MKKDTVKNKIPLNVLLLGLVSMFIDMSTEMVYPIMPMFLVALGATPAIIGIIEGVTEGLATVLRAFAGYVSDKTKRKKGLTVAGYSAALIYKLGVLLSTSWAAVFISKIIDRTGKGLRTAPRDSIIAECDGGLGKNYGLHKMFDKLGAALGVSLAYVILVSEFDYDTVIWWSVLPAAIGVLLLTFIKENKRNITEYEVKQPQTKALSLKNVKLGKKVWLYLVAVFVFSIGNSSNAFLLLKARNAGVGETDTLLVYLLFSVFASALSIPLGKLSDKIGRKTVITSAYFLYSAVYIGFALVRGVWGIAALFAVYGVYHAMITGAEKAQAVEMVPHDLKGTVLGLQGMAQGIGLFLSSLLAGVLWQYVGPSFPFYFGAVLAAAAAVAMPFILRLPDKKTAD